MAQEKNRRDIALNRAEELKEKIEEYLSVKDSIPRGLSNLVQEKIQQKKEKILSMLQKKTGMIGDGKLVTRYVT